MAGWRSSLREPSGRRSKLSHCQVTYFLRFQILDRKQTMALYSKVTFWDHRYRANEAPYEWYQGYGSLRHILNPIHFAAQGAHSLNPSTSRMLGGSTGAGVHDGAATFPGASQPPLPLFGPSDSSVRRFPSREQCRTLILGCGNATFGEDMQRDGWTGRIVNVDFSPVVIDQMRAKYSPDYYQHNLFPPGTQPMEWLHADITQVLPFHDGTFDLIVCKGSFDAVLCGTGSRFNVLRVVQECVRLLSPGTGVFFLVTHGNPDSRIEYLECDNNLYHYWSSVHVHTVVRPSTFQGNHAQHHSHYQHHPYGMVQHQHAFPPPRTDYVYVCRKRPTDPPGVMRGVAENVASASTFPPGVSSLKIA